MEARGPKPGCRETVSLFLPDQCLKENKSLYQEIKVSVSLGNDHGASLLGAARSYLYLTSVLATDLTAPTVSPFAESAWAL